MDEIPICHEVIFADYLEVRIGRQRVYLFWKLLENAIGCCYISYFLALLQVEGIEIFLIVSNPPSYGLLVTN